MSIRCIHGIDAQATGVLVGTLSNFHSNDLFFRGLYIRILFYCMCWKKMEHINSLSRSSLAYYPNYPARLRASLFDGGRRADASLLFSFAFRIIECRQVAT